ncbi:MAG: BatD family protein [Opitutaceae bacterium]|nr:BatD family protein [Opitutaceae bacterium]
MRSLRLAFLFCLLVAAACAQSVQWQASDSGDPSELQLVFENCAPEGDPALPSVPNVTFSFAGRSEQTSIVNFSMTRSVILNYRVRARAAGSVSIPAFTVKTTEGTLRVPAFTTGAMRQAAEANIYARLLPGVTSAWAGEVFPLAYSLDVSRRNFNQLGGPIEWDSAPLIVEDWSKPEPAEFTANGETRLNIAYKTRAYAKAPGTVTIHAASQLVNVATGTIGFGLFQQPRVEQLSVTSNQPAVNVRPLPLPAPAGFSGAVGQFRLNSKVVPATAAVGEPVTWTLELSGTGNWPDVAGLPAREVSRDFQVISPQAKRTPAEGRLFDATLAEDVVLVPTKPGTYTLAPVEFTYFDPKTGTYQTLTTPRTTVTISAPAAPRFNIAPSAEATGPAVAAATPPKPPAPPELPSALPRDPLPGSASAPVPFARVRNLVLAALAPFAALGVFWLGLSARRAALTDPGRARRLARQRLGATLDRLAQAPAAERAALLLAWQHDTAVLCRIPHAAPAASALADPAWQRLWSEADRALYGPPAELPADWADRARAALAASRVPGFAAWRILHPRNLLPLLALAAVLAASDLRAADAAAAYRQGDYATAEKAWAEVVQRDPADWAARHNLALALAQQDRWTEAAAQATAAFVQHPADDGGRLNLALACEKAGYTPGTLAPFLAPGPRHALARLASPAEWERAAVASATLIALALGVLLYGRFQRAPAWGRYLALAAIVAGLLAGTAALVGRDAYGLAAHPQAALAWRGTTLHSIPTEAEINQQTTALAAGSLGVMNRTFLGWVRLRFEDGRTGWVRKQELVPLWR